MPPIPAADSGTYRPYTKLAGSEPLPGYKLLSPLGRGGFGEVWRCEAPGGLQKAIKFVTSEAEDGRGGERFDRELAAFEQIKSIRHPFLLTLERVEHIGSDLIMVMELADRQLQDRFRECHKCGLPGIPRDELLAYFADAAEALDVIGAKFNLQHLDVKPANLFIVSGHVKVGDYGLVAQLEGPDAGNRGLTPRYVAPEVLHGTPSSFSDQYSLALVYAELLTGVFPYTGRTPTQLMLQHVSGQPNLTALPFADQPVVAKALAKKPEDRFASCLAFVQALMTSGVVTTPAPDAALNLRRARVERSVAELGRATGTDAAGGDSSMSSRADPTHPGRPPTIQETENFTLPAKPNQTVPGHAPAPLPPLVTGNRPPTARVPVPAPRTPAQSDQPAAPTPPAVQPPPPVAPPRAKHGGAPVPPPRAKHGVPQPPLDLDPPVADEVGLVVLDRVVSIVPVATLLGGVGELSLDPEEFAAAVVQAVAAGGSVPQMPGDVGRQADGAWVCRFPSTVPATVVGLKLGVLHDHWGVSIEQPEPTKMVLRRTAGGGFFGRRYGFEVSVFLPPGVKPLGEVTVLGRTFGPVGSEFAREAQDIIPKVLLDVRTQLGNVQERRKHPRLACELGLTLYPIHSDGSVDLPVLVKCRDVSLGGLGFRAAKSPQTKYVYAAFPDVPGTAAHAILLRLVRSKTIAGERHYGALYRMDLE